MPSPYSREAPIEQKGKRLFIDSLERHKDLSYLIGRIRHQFLNPNCYEVVLYFRQRFRPFPNIMAPLACALDSIRGQGRNPRVLLTFPELDETFCLAPTTFSNEFGSPVGRVWRYESSHQANQLHQAVIQFLSYHLIWERGTLFALEWLLYELLDNVFEHANTNVGYFMFQIQQNNRRLSLCVADQGRGIWRSFLSSKYKPLSAIDAISLAVKKGVTRDPKVGQGNGLWGTTEIIARNSGQLTLSSSGAAFYFDRLTRAATTVDNVSVLSEDAPGTYIDVQIDSSKSVLLEDMFGALASPVNLRLEALENEDGATVFKLADFGFGLGTREAGSFAFAYASNLLKESFAPLVIDFSDVGIVSSSFADEFIAKLFLLNGEHAFNTRVRLNGMSETAALIVRQSILQRREKG